MRELGAGCKVWSLRSCEGFDMAPFWLPLRTFWNTLWNLLYRAREIPLPGGGPKVFRSEDEPESLSGLSSYDQKRVDLANSVYDTCCKLILHCIAEGVDSSLEQPKRSIFWWTKYWKAVLAATQPCYATLSACMYGWKAQIHNH